MKQRYYHIAAVLAALLSASCVGIGAGISIRQNGSGTIDLEYRISAGAESLGRLDGNEGWPIIPVGRTDFERTAARVEGLKLRSYSSRNDGKDLICRVKLEFSHPTALVRFLDPSGKRASFTEENGERRLVLVLPLGNETTGGELRELFVAASTGYTVSLGFSLPREGTLSLSGKDGAPRPPPAGAEVFPRGKKLSFSAPLGSLLAETGELSVVVRW